MKLQQIEEATKVLSHKIEILKRRIKANPFADYSFEMNAIERKQKYLLNKIKRMEMTINERRN